MFESIQALEPRFQSWYDAVFIRHSTRGYQDKDLTIDEQMKIMKSKDAMNALSGGTRIELVFGREETKYAFGMLGGYGTIKQAHAFAAFVAAEKDGDASENAGYFGEAFVLDLTAQGFDTCWVSGTLNRGMIGEILDLGPNEKVLAATPVGYAADKMGAMERFTKAYSKGAQRKPLDKICPEYETLPDWAKKCVECAQKAPSATNNQPWLFGYEGGALTLGKIPKNGMIPYAMDIGICMLHVAIAASAAGGKGAWEKTAPEYHAVFKAQF